MLGVNGFGQVVIEAVLGRTVRGARGGGQTESDENHVVAVPRLAKPPGDAAAVHERRADVDDADVWTHRLQQFEPAYNVGRVVDHVPGEFERHSQTSRARPRLSSISSTRLGLARRSRGNATPP